MPAHARFADLVVAGQPDLDDADTFVAPHFLDNLLLSSGRPVLLVPYTLTSAAQPLGTRPMIAWDGSRAAARALHDAMPLLTQASAVSVVMMRDAEHEEPEASLAGQEIRAALACHGVKADIHVRRPIRHRDLGEALLSEASNLDSDMIIAGAYGHARVQEFLLGSVTRTLLERMTVPVLMSC